MAALLIDRRGVFLTCEGECLIIRMGDVPAKTVPMRRLDKIICLHGVSLDSRLLGQCQCLGIDFIVLNQRHSDRSFALHAPQQRQAARRLAQYEASCNLERAYALSRRLVLHKITMTICQLRSCADMQTLQRLRQARQTAKAAESMDSLRGHEGVAQRIMFDFWRARLPEKLGFTGRNRRPPKDPVNALLSLSATLTYHEAIRQCLRHGLDPWLGFYHQAAPGRRALACDLMEPLRPKLASWVADLLQQGELDLRYFSNSSAGCLLGKQGREIFYRHWQALLPWISRRLGRYAAMFGKTLQADEVRDGEGMVLSEL